MLDGQVGGEGVGEAGAGRGRALGASPFVAPWHVGQVAEGPRQIHEVTHAPTKLAPTTDAPGPVDDEGRGDPAFMHPGLVQP